MTMSLSGTGYTYVSTSIGTPISGNYVFASTASFWNINYNVPKNLYYNGKTIDLKLLYKFLDSIDEKGRIHLLDEDNSLIILKPKGST